MVQSNFREQHVRQQGFTTHIPEKESFDFFKNLRVTKKTFRFLLDIFKKYYNPVHLGGREPVPTDTLLLLTLWYLGNQTTYREISELFGLSEGRIHVCVQEGIKILNSHG